MLETKKNKEQLQKLRDLTCYAEWAEMEIYLNEIVERRRDKLEKEDSDLVRGEIKAYRKILSLKSDTRK